MLSSSDPAAVPKPTTGQCARSRKTRSRASTDSTPNQNRWISSQKYAALDWSVYFDQEDDVCIPDSDNVFHIYKAGTEGSVVFCFHGGGYSGLALALSASKIKEKARVVALDMRGHGKSSTDNDLDLSIEVCAFETATKAEEDVFQIHVLTFYDRRPFP